MVEAKGHDGRQEYKVGKNGAKHNHSSFKTKVGLQEVYKEHGGRKGGRRPLKDISYPTRDYYSAKCHFQTM